MTDLKDAFKLWWNLAPRPKKSKTIALKDALHRILASEIRARCDIPRFDNSAMDGYALRLGYESYKVKDIIFAGNATKCAISDNEAYKIMTGAAIPRNTQAVIPKEHTKIINDKLILTTQPQDSQCIKRKGEDFKKGEILLPKGKILNAQDIGILASQGISRVKVAKKTKILLLGSGNEVVPLNARLKNGQIYDLNSHFLRAFLAQFYCKIRYGGILKDNVATLTNALRKALKRYDIIITSGGASVGDKDYIHEALREINAEVLLDGLNIKPGKPVVFSRKNNAFILSLPGNPIAAFLHCIFCVPILTQKFANAPFYMREIPAINAHEFRTTPDTSHIILGRYENGYFHAYNNAKYQGAQIAPLLKSNALAIIYNQRVVAKNAALKVLLYKAEFFATISDIFNELE